MKFFKYFLLCCFFSLNFQMIYSYEKMLENEDQTNDSNFNEDRIYINENSIVVSPDGLSIMVQMPVSSLRTDNNGTYLVPSEELHFGTWCCRFCYTMNTNGYTRCYNCHRHRYE